MQKDHGIGPFESTLQASCQWIHEYGVALGERHPPRAFRHLRAALHAIRDQLPLTDAVALGAQLPMLLRGAYFEGFAPGRTPEPDSTRTSEQHRDRLGCELVGRLETSSHDAVRALFTLLEKRLDPGLLGRVRQLLPEDLRDLSSDAVPRAAAPLPAERSAPIESAQGTR